MPSLAPQPRLDALASREAQALGNFFLALTGCPDRPRLRAIPPQPGLQPAFHRNPHAFGADPGN